MAELAPVVDALRQVERAARALLDEAPKSLYPDQLPGRASVSIRSLAALRDAVAAYQLARLEALSQEGSGA